MLPRRPGGAPRPRRRNLTVVIRVAIYVTAAVMFFMLRGRVDWGLLAHRVSSTTATADSTLTIGGIDVAPYLAETMIRRYRDYYPTLRIDTRPGTTVQALQDLVDGKADAVFLARPPSAADQAAFRKSSGDTATWYPIALGALLVVAEPTSADSSVTMAELKARAFSAPQAGRRLYAVDRNAGMWDAIVERLGGAPEASTGTYFLANEDSVLNYALADRGAMGIISVFPLRRPLSAYGARALAVQKRPDTLAVRADNVTLATSGYPLWCYTYLACARRGSMQGSTFVTYVTSARGQRQIEATPYLPAEKILREVVITRPPKEE